jgi:transposase
MPKRTVKELLADLFGIEVALGSVSKMEQFVSKAVAEPVEEAQQAVRVQDVVHQDETGWFEAPSEGRKARPWLWVAVSAAVTVFRIARSRGAKVAKEMLGEDFGGFLVVVVGLPVEATRDAPGLLGAPRQRLPQLRRARRRERQDRRESPRPVEADVPLLASHPGRDPHPRDVPAQDEENGEVGGRLLRKAAVCGDAKTEGMVKQILKHEPALITFVLATGVEPTNNVPERALRGAVIWRKISFGTDSENGSRFVERILTVVATLRQQRRHVLAYLTAACEASLHGRPAPSLLPSP